MTDGGGLKAERARSRRIVSIDALRGLLMALMALDHAVLIVAQQHGSSEMWGGALPVYPSTLALVTRLATHLCAPGFALLMGAGMSLLWEARRRRGQDPWNVRRNLILRGLFLMALQFVFVGPMWRLQPGIWETRLYVGVLWALGGSMIIGSLLLSLRPGWLVGVALSSMVLVHLLIPGSQTWGYANRPLDLLLWLPGGLVRDGAVLLWSNYPILDWLGIVLLGMALGKWIGLKGARILDTIWIAGLAMVLLFVPLRAMDGFGNIRPMPGRDLTAWLTLVKYPPSLTFTLLTVGTNLILLSLFHRLFGGPPRDAGHSRLVGRVLCVLGRHALLFYCLHIPLYVAMAHLFAPRGTPLWMATPWWLIGLVPLWFACWRIERRPRRAA